MEASQRPVFVRVSDSKKLLGIHRSTIYRWAKEGLFKIYRLRGVSMVNVAEFEAALGAGSGKQRKG